MPTKKDIVVFLGAGFTHDLELPIMSNFNSASDREYDGITADVNKNKKATPRLKKAGKIFQKFQKYSLNVSEFMNIDINNMEDVFCLADIIEGTSISSNPISEVDNLRINEIITDIRLWLWKIFQQCPPINNKRLTAQNNVYKYKKFFQFLIDEHKKNTNISIITTNYDLMPEFFINELKGKCTYNIQHRCKEWKVLKDSTRKFVGVDDNGSIPIYKLHGSVNYFFNGNGNKDIVNIVIDKLNAKARVGNSIGPKTEKIFANRPSLFPMDAIFELKKSNSGQIPTPAIIPPMYSKIESMKWLKSIWNNSLTAIRNAKIIVFIGYSFPQSDGFMKSFFQSALIGRKNQKPPIIINLDKNKDIKGTYCKIFNNMNDENFLTGTFIEKYSDLINLMDRQIKA